MTTTLEQPTALRCTCQDCTCTVQADRGFRSGTLHFRSNACACHG